MLGWVEDVPCLLKSAHLLIGKAGGAMVQEALAAGTPMLVTQILPGQEEGNAMLLIQNGCGVFCPTNEAVVLTVNQLFEGDSMGWRRMKTHAQRLGKPSAAVDLAKKICEGLGSPSSPKNRAFGVRGN